MRTTEAVLPWELLLFFFPNNSLGQGNQQSCGLAVAEAFHPVPWPFCHVPTGPKTRAGVGGKLTSTVQALHFLSAPSWVHAGNQLPGPHQCEDDLSAEEEHLLNLIRFSLGLRTELRALPGNKAAGTGPEECWKYKTPGACHEGVATYQGFIWEWELAELAALAATRILSSLHQKPLTIHLLTPDRI